jgi:cytochrome c-type biogenesis protein CcmH
MMRYWSMLLLFMSLPAFAVIETYQFADDSLKARYQQFVEELRCPKCQNQNLSGSNSQIAEDLRREVHRLLHEGKSDKEIVDYMVARYGEFVLYRPPVDEKTALLWGAPLLLLGLGALVVALVLLRQRRRAGVISDESLSAQEQETLKALLAKSSSEKEGD